MTKMHSVQKEALRLSANKPGFAFFMEQGLGKTLTSLNDFMELYADFRAQRMVVICPNSFKGGWVEEIKKHGFKVDAHIYDAKHERATHSWITKKEYFGVPVLIVNYEAIRSAKVQLIIEKFTMGRPCAIYADESIQISTFDSAQTKAAIGIAKNFAFRRVLSGKPQKQGPHDLWAQLRFIGKLDGYNYYAFRNRHCIMGGFKNKQVVGVRNADVLAELLSDCSFTARKVDWTDLPPKLWTTKGYNLNDDLQVHFDEMYNEFITWINDDQNVAVDIAITKYMKLAQIQVGFIYDEQGEVHWLVKPKSNPRLQLLLELIEDEIPGKVAIPYSHKPVFDLLYGALAKYNPAFIKGGMKTDEIEAQKAKFNDDPSCRVILLQTRASKYGHTLLGGSEPADICSTMVFFENTYSLDDRSQIEDRIHRYGQVADSVLYIDLAGTEIDRRMSEALQRKEEMFQALLTAIKEGVR